MLFQAGGGGYKVRLLYANECARLIGANAYNANANKVTIRFNQAIVWPSRRRGMDRPAWPKPACRRPSKPRRGVVRTSKPGLPGVSIQKGFAFVGKTRAFHETAYILNRISIEPGSRMCANPSSVVCQES